MPPKKTADNDDPGQHACASMQRQKYRAKVALVTRGFMRPDTCKLHDDQKHRKPVKNDAGPIKAILRRLNYDDRSCR
jgi:hypothetical protein